MRCGASYFMNNFLYCFLFEYVSSIAILSESNVYEKKKGGRKEVWPPIAAAVGEE